MGADSGLKWPFYKKKNKEKEKRPLVPVYNKVKGRVNLLPNLSDLPTV